MKIPGYFITLILAMVFSSIRAQDVIVRALLDTNKALIGDQIKLRLLVESSKNWQVDFPELQDSLTRDIEIISKTQPDTATGMEGRQVISQDLLIAVFDTGFFEIPALTFSVRTTELSDTLSTLPVGFEILSVKADSTIRDIKAIYYVPVSLRELAPYIIGLIILGLLAWFLVYYVKHRKTSIIRRSFAAAHSSEPPEVIALRDLEKLKQEKPWLDNRVKYYYSRISEILRTYIESRYSTLALEQTTDEILWSLKPPVCDAKNMNKLSSILRLSDLVKFAKVVPDVEESAVQVDVAVEFVRNTSVTENETVAENEHEQVMVQNNSSS